jgi:hypothetical protein
MYSNIYIYQYINFGGVVHHHPLKPLPTRGARQVQPCPPVLWDATEEGKEGEGGAAGEESEG